MEGYWTGIFKDTVTGEVLAVIAVYPNILTNAKSVLTGVGVFTPWKRTHDKVLPVLAINPL